MPWFSTATLASKRVGVQTAGWVVRPTIVPVVGRSAANRIANHDRARRLTYGTSTPLMTQWAVVAAVGMLAAFDVAGLDK
jgi:hypothetical protein